MAREKEGYRDNLERINEAFDHELLTVSEVASFCGISYASARRWFSFHPLTKRISKADLARQMCA